MRLGRGSDERIRWICVGRPDGAGEKFDPSGFRLLVGGVGSSPAKPKPTIFGGAQVP
jgi:hypothetical protein